MSTSPKHQWGTAPLPYNSPVTENLVLLRALTLLRPSLHAIRAYLLTYSSVYISWSRDLAVPTHIEEEKPQNAFVCHDEERIAGGCVYHWQPVHTVFVQHLYCFKQTRFRCDVDQRPSVFRQLIYTRNQYTPHYTTLHYTRLGWVDR